jgi:4-hydroxyphenylpyruvate dioxygenase
MNDQASHREVPQETPNRLGLAGIEYVEYATTRPQALGQVLQTLGFKPVARHRSREVLLYRQGGFNLIVNAHPDDARVAQTEGGNPVLCAVALRVQDARLAFERCVQLGAWAAPAHAQAMELHIPAIHGPGGSRFYFVDRWRDFSIFDIDFLPIPSVDTTPAALAPMSYFGVVQYIGLGRSAEWLAFYETLFGFVTVPDDERYGIMPAGKLMKSPCGRFMWQLVEPVPDTADEAEPECLRRIGLGVADVPGMVALLKSRGVQFVESAHLHPEDRGALTQTLLGSVAFELVHQDAPQAAA